jgi:hypothetical protein
MSEIPGNALAVLYQENVLSDSRKGMGNILQQINVAI